MPLGFPGGTCDAHGKPQVRESRPGERKSHRAQRRASGPAPRPPTPTLGQATTGPRLATAGHCEQVASSRPTVRTRSLARAAHPQGTGWGSERTPPTLNVSSVGPHRAWLSGTGTPPDGGPAVRTLAPSGRPGPGRLHMQMQLLFGQLLQLPGTSMREASASATRLGARVPSWGQAGWSGPQPPGREARGPASSACLPALPSPQLCLALCKAFCSCWGCVPCTGSRSFSRPGLRWADSRPGRPGEAGPFSRAPEPSSVLPAPYSASPRRTHPWSWHCPPAPLCMGTSCLRHRGEVCSFLPGEGERDPIPKSKWVPGCSLGPGQEHGRSSEQRGLPGKAAWWERPC